MRRLDRTQYARRGSTIVPSSHGAAESRLTSSFSLLWLLCQWYSGGMLNTPWLYSVSVCTLSPRRTSDSCMTGRRATSPFQWLSLVYFSFMLLNCITRRSLVLNHMEKLNKPLRFYDIGSTKLCITICFCPRLLLFHCIHPRRVTSTKTSSSPFAKKSV